MTRGNDGNTGASRTVLAATALGGAAAALLGSVGASVLGQICELRFIGPAAALGLGLWGGCAGFGAARRGFGSARGLLWGVALVAGTFALSLTVMLTLVNIVARPSHNQLWPLNVIFESAAGLGVVALFTVGALVVAAVTLPFIGWLAARLAARARQGEAAAARFGAGALAVLGALKLVTNPFSSVGLVAVLCTVAGALVLAARARATGLVVLVAALGVGDAATHLATHAYLAQPPATRALCYTATNNANVPSQGRGAFALAAEQVSGVTAARALYTEGYYEGAVQRPRVDVAVELAAGSDEPATLSRVRKALAKVRCSDGESGTMVAHVLAGRAHTLDVVVEAQADAATSPELLREALMRQLVAEIAPVPEWFITNHQRGAVFAISEAAHLGVAGVHALTLRIAGGQPNPDGSVSLAMAPGEHAVLGNLDVRLAR